MQDSILNSINILYTPNIENLKIYNKYIDPNNLIISSYYNPGTYIGYDYYQGLSYELYFVDGDRNINQLTYNLVEGNGLVIKDNKFGINLDNYTLMLVKDEEDNTYINVNSENFKTASKLNKGILNIENDVYYNDNYIDTNNNKGAFNINQTNNIIILSNGLVGDLNKLKYYYKRAKIILDSLYKIYIKCIEGLPININVKVGDILYIDAITQEYTLEEYHNGNKNTPIMVCVIASNVLSDGEPRFIPLKRNTNKMMFDSSNNIYLKRATNKVPIYNTNKLSRININTQTVESNQGYIAVKRNDWKNNLTNPLNSSENYYNVNRILNLENGDSQTLKWYIDFKKINYNDNYTISPEGVFTELVNNKIQNLIADSKIYFIITINFSNEVTKYYLCNFKLKNNRLVNLDTLYGYNTKKTITNNFQLSINNEKENYIELSKLEIKESSNFISEYHNIKDSNSLKNVDINKILNDNKKNSYVMI